MKKILNEFKNFALKGNVMDLAVGVIIGGAFQSVVSSLTEDILSPIIGFFARQDFSQQQIVIFDAPIRYGAFITAVINFIIMALVVFLLVKGVNHILSLTEKKETAMEEPEKEQEVTEKACPFCTSKISIEAIRCPYCTSKLSK